MAPKVPGYLEVLPSELLLPQTPVHSDSLQVGFAKQEAVVPQRAAQGDRPDYAEAGGDTRVINPPSGADLPSTGDSLKQ